MLALSSEIPSQDRSADVLTSVARSISTPPGNCRGGIAAHPDVQHANEESLVRCGLGQPRPRLFQRPAIVVTAVVARRRAPLRRRDTLWRIVPGSRATPYRPPYTRGPGPGRTCPAGSPRGFHKSRDPELLSRRRDHRQALTVNSGLYAAAIRKLRPGRRGNPSAWSHPCSTSGGVPHHERARFQLVRQLTG
jgi:hypothetical protein